MQEPNIFNYSILENILYGNLNASNSEVVKAAEIANCKEFIEENNFKGTDDSTKEIQRLMELKKDMIVELIGEDKYKEELEVIKKIVEQDEKKGTFVAASEDIDSREESKRDTKLYEGYNTQCGIKGGKLSGGQK